MCIRDRSSAVAASVVVSPTDANVSLVLLSTTDAATWLTVTDAVVLAEPLVAVIVASPFATAVTVPLETVAIASSLDAHVTV